MSVIVGAGPSGLLLAHLLIYHSSENEFIQKLLPIKIFEARGDPRTPLPLYKNRQYVVGLSARGRDAISKINGLWECIEKEGVASSQFVLHIGKRKIALKRNPDKPSLLINQRSLTAVLVKELQERYSSDQVQVNYGARCIGADFHTHTVKFKLQNDENEHVVPYNLLVGADGARSIVRESFINERGFDYQQINVPYIFKVLYVPKLEELSDNAVHTFRVTKKDSQGTSTNLGFGCFPTHNASAVLIAWSPKTEPKELLQIQDANELKEYIEKYMPPLKVTLEGAQAFISQRPTSSMQVSCGRFYDERGQAVLIGDAAHAMSNALGQGCNSSLQDVQALCEMLLKENNIISAIKEYSDKQVKEDHAAAYLSQNAFPELNLLRPVYLLSNILSSVLSNTPISRLVPPSIQSLCSETLTPYSEIVRRNKLWLKLVEVTNLLGKEDEF